MHEPVTVRRLSLWHIISAINAPSYKLVKFLIPVLTALISNNYTLKDSFSVAEEVPSSDYAYYMTSFDKESLFTNISLEKAVNICVDKRLGYKTKVNNLNKESLL